MYGRKGFQGESGWSVGGVVVNEDAYEDYLRDKVALEESLEEMESRLAWLLDDVKGLRSDIESTQEELNSLGVEDYFE